MALNENDNAIITSIRLILDRFFSTVHGSNSQLSNFYLSGTWKSKTTLITNWILSPAFFLISVDEQLSKMQTSVKDLFPKSSPKSVTFSIFHYQNPESVSNTTTTLHIRIVSMSSPSSSLSIKPLSSSETLEIKHITPTKKRKREEDEEEEEKEKEKKTMSEMDWEEIDKLFYCKKWFQDQLNQMHHDLIPDLICVWYNVFKCLQHSFEKNGYLMELTPDKRRKITGASSSSFSLAIHNWTSIAVSYKTIKLEFGPLKSLSSKQLLTCKNMHLGDLYVHKNQLSRSLFLVVHLNV